MRFAAHLCVAKMQSAGELLVLAFAKRRNAPTFDWKAIRSRHMQLSKTKDLKSSQWLRTGGQRNWCFALQTMHGQGSKYWITLSRWRIGSQPLLLRDAGWAHSSGRGCSALEASALCDSLAQPGKLLPFAVRTPDSGQDALQ